MSESSTLDTTAPELPIPEIRFTFFVLSFVLKHQSVVVKNNLIYA